MNQRPEDRDKGAGRKIDPAAPARPRLSILIPAYNEAGNLPGTIRDIQNHLLRTEFADFHEIIVVDDHSTDGTYEVARSLQGQHVGCLRLSKNNGSHTAMRMGLPFTRGDAVIVLSADGQDDPQAIPDLLGKWKQGAQVVWALRRSRKGEPFFKKMAATAFYRILAFLLKSRENPIDLSRADFYLLDRKMVAAINSCREKNTSLFGLISWMGFRQDSVEYDRRERTIGKSKWSVRKRVGLAKDWIVAFSGLPLKAISIAGGIIAFLGFLYALYIIGRALKGNPVQGWSSLMVVILLLGGLQMIMFGVLGEYLWRNLDESRKRPLAFIEKSTLEEPERLEHLPPKSFPP